MYLRISYMKGFTKTPKTYVSQIFVKVDKCLFEGFAYWKFWDLQIVICTKPLGTFLFNNSPRVHRKYEYWQCLNEHFVYKGIDRMLEKCMYLGYNILHQEVKFFVMLKVFKCFFLFTKTLSNSKIFTTYMNIFTKAQNPKYVPYRILITLLFLLSNFTESQTFISMLHGCSSIFFSRSEAENYWLTQEF